MELTEKQKKKVVDDEIEHLFQKSLPKGISEAGKENLRKEFEKVRPALFRYLWNLFGAVLEKKESSN